MNKRLVKTRFSVGFLVLLAGGIKRRHPKEARCLQCQTVPEKGMQQAQPVSCGRTAIAKYEAEKGELAHLIKLRNKMQKEELMEAVIKSDHYYAEIMTFIKSAETQEE